MRSNKVDTLKGYTVNVEDVELQREAVLIATYLLKHSPSESIIHRYMRGVQTRLPLTPEGIDKSIQSFILQHPWSLLYLDAVSAFLAPKNLLRSKILLMIAILETTTEYYDHFSPSPSSRIKVIGKILLITLSSFFQVLIGFVLLTWLHWRRV